jgi:hypothetical protein
MNYFTGIQRWISPFFSKTNHLHFPAGLTANKNIPKPCEPGFANSCPNNP